MKREIVHVDEFGRDERGEDFALSASDEAIAKGLMLNVPVTLVFPDGRKLDRNKAVITQKGMEFLSARRPWEGGAS